MRSNTISATPTAQVSASVCSTPLARHIQFGFGLEVVWKEKKKALTYLPLIELKKQVYSPANSTLL